MLTRAGSALVSSSTAPWWWTSDRDIQAVCTFIVFYTFYIRSLPSTLVLSYFSSHFLFVLSFSFLVS